MADAEATISERRRLSAIWLVPIVAAVLGLWMVIYTIRSQGPEITIVFSTAEGLEAGKTKIKLRSVEVGLVESAGLGDDLESVVVVARVEKEAESLLREDTQFWVVRPRVGPGGISGIGTLLSGGYIQLEPGSGEEGRREFVGLEEPPVTPVGTPGLHVRLVSERAGSIGTGDPILYKGYRVGRIESASFDMGTHEMHYRAFIEAPYSDLVSAATRFWNASGVQIRTSADGIEVSTGSLESILAGGVSFGLPEGVDPGAAVEPGTAFKLFPDYVSVNERPYVHGVDYVVLFTQSVRGLQPGAPVEYRGIQVGLVDRILIEEMAAGLRGQGQPVPVLIRLEPGRFGLPDSEAAAANLGRAIEHAVSIGGRAALATGNLLTGSLYVTFDLYSHEKPATLGTFAGRPTLPTVASGLEGIQVQVVALLEKLNDLPLEDITQSAANAVADVEAILADEKLQELPEALDATLAELRGAVGSVSEDSVLQERLLRTIVELDRTLGSLRALLGTLQDKPNAVIFAPDPLRDPVPPAGNP